MLMEVVWFYCTLKISNVANSTTNKNYEKGARVMNHPKMKYTYVGIDSHKETHTAVFIDCFFDKLGEITFNNLPSAFDSFLSGAEKYALEGTTLLFGMEDVSAYGRMLAVYLKQQGQPVKHVNALLVAWQRKNQNITQKTDAVDAECAACVLLSKFGELPDAKPQDNYWTLRTLVVRRNFIIKNNTALKNSLHNLIMIHYPKYYSHFFHNIDCKSSLAFLMRYPSPSTLEGVTVEELTDCFYEASQGIVGADKAQEVLENLEDTTVDYQEMRDMAVQSVIRQLQFNLDEVERLEKTLAQVLDSFNCTLTSMTGIDTVTAAQLLSCIGDIRAFPSPAKLARYAGIAPVTYASGNNDFRFANERGNRELNSIFFKLAVRVSATVGSTNKVINSFFYDYYHRKRAEGKTKRQALKCVQRRLVNIIWTMLTNREEYVNPPMYDLPKKEKKKIV
jgi:transposase